MRINHLTIKPELICFSYTVNEGSEAESKKIEECPDVPKPDLGEKFALLPNIACRIMEWPAKYAAGMSVYKLAIRATKMGTRSVQFKLVRPVEMAPGKQPPITTPWVRIDKPQDGESGSVDLHSSELATIEEAIFEITEYIAGNRAQGILSLKDAKDALNATAALGKQEPDLLSKIK